MAESAEPTLAAVRFGAMQRKGVLLGLSAPRLAALAVATMAVSFGLFVGGTSGLLVLSPLIVVLVVAALLPIAGRTPIEWLPVVGNWAVRRATQQTIYRKRIFTIRPAGTLALPGDAAALRAYVDPITAALMIHDPHRHTLSVTCQVSYPSFVLLGVENQVRRVSGWGRALASLARVGHIASIQVLEATVPDDGGAVRDWWSRNRQPSDTWATRTYDAFVQAAAPSAARHRTTVTLTLDMKKAARAIQKAGRGVHGAAAVLHHDMAAFETALRSADLTVGRWLRENELSQVIRSAYDPAGAATRDAAGVVHRATSAGPVGVREHWTWLESDSSASAVLWISEWPRTDAFPNFLHPLVLAQGVRRSISLLARPIPASEARREIRRQKANYLSDADQKARVGQVADLSDEREYQDVLRREEEVAMGHADMRFAGLIAITAPDKESLDVAVGAIEQAAIQCECETRLLVGQQSQAFTAAAIPLGRGL